MTPLAVVLIGLIAFCWLFIRSVKAGHGRLLFWLLYFIGGTCVVIALPTPPTLVEKVIVNAWAYSVLLLPLWWFIQWLRPRRVR
jgi:hypothetical protein